MPATPPPHLTLTLWRRAEVVALAITVPAFYLALLAEHRVLAVGLYLLGAAACAAVAVHERHERRRTSESRQLGYQRGLSLLLIAALVLSALLPQGDGAFVLGTRLVTAALIVLRWGESLRLLWFWRGSLPYLLALAVGVLGLCGVGFWWLDPRIQTFGDGLWLAFTTAATVGYGDMVPSTPAAKIFAVFVVLMAFGVLSLVTASIAAMWVQTEERRIEREILRDLHHQMASLREDLAALREASRRDACSEREPV
ncbi:MAG: two pore domain potassium channel family protein [Rhizobacter sp.]|nr:two pore domain potassium channel family protein [Rhizobacter sp.]